MSKLCYFILLVTVTTSVSVFSQKMNLLTAKVYDEQTHEPLPLVQVYNYSKKTATTTTEEGTFKLEDYTLNDSITFYQIGYVKKGIKVNELLGLDTVFLEPEVHSIDEVVILADNSLLYDLISSCKKYQPHASDVAKTYAEIDTYSENKQIELLQGYYNGYFTGYDLTDLTTKNVRFGLRPAGDRLYTSMGVSKIFYEHKLFESSDLFPGNPMLFNYKGLRKKYDLFLNTRFQEEGKIIYVISFQPKNNTEPLFSGKIWIDSAERKIYQLVLETKDTQKHPFESIWDLDRLSHVNLKITKTFSNENDTIQTRLIDFEYSFDYQTNEHTILNIKNHTGLNAFDYTEVFNEPRFDFSKEREMSRTWNELMIIEYDSLFWACTKAYQSSSDFERNRRFYNDSLTVSNHKLLTTQQIKNGNTIGTANKGVYRKWNADKRIFFKDLGTDTSITNNLQGAIPHDHYKLCVQIYMDITQVCDSVKWVTQTLFDPFKTYYHYPVTMETIIFMNIYFDLMEVQRRKLDIALQACGNDIDRMQAVYNELLDEVNNQSERYFKDVNRGLDKEQLKKWNTYIRENLGIDNMVLFLGE